MLVPDLHAAAQHLHKIGYNIAFEYAHKIRLKAVQNFASHRHQALKFRVSGLLAGAQSGVALHDVYFPHLRVPAAAVHELLHPVCDVDGAGEFFLHAQPGFFRRFAGALVYEHLLGYAVGLGLVFYEIYLQTGLEKVRHGLLNEFVGDGLFGLIFIGGLGRKAVRHQHKAVLYVLKGYLGLVLLVFALLFYISVNGINKAGAGGLFRAAAVLQPG